MCRRTLLLVSLGLLLHGTASSTRAELVAYWPLDEGSGTTVGDVMGVWDGTITGNVSWIDGHQGSALDFPGGNNFVNFGNVEIGPSMTLSYWCFNAAKTFERPLGQQAGNYSAVPGWAVYSRDEGEGGVWFRVHGADDAWNGGDIIIADNLPKDEWYHLAFTFDGDTRELKGYFNGELKASKICEAGRAIYPAPSDLRLGNTGAGGAYTGALDEIAIWDHVMTEDEILAAMDGHLGGANPSASRPEPEDGALYESNWANMRWKAGAFAVSHDLYIGTSFDDVNDGTEGTFVGNTGAVFQVVGFAGFPFPDGLQPGTTYYWRVDEVNDANAASPWKGDVWSFWIPPKKAYEPVPADGLQFVMPGVSLSWTAQWKTVMYAVYFGTDAETVAGGEGGPPVMDASFEPGPLASGTTYYWRADIFDGAQWIKGDVWSFSMMPEIHATDPTLVAWWKLDEESGTTAVDWSGHGNHGTLVGPQWISPARHGPGLNFSPGGYIAIGNLNYASSDLTAVTVSAWIRTSSGSDQYIISFDRSDYYRLEINGNGAGQGQVGWDVMTSSGQVDSGSVSRIDDGRWHHVCGVFDNGRLIIYIDGVLESSATGGPTYGSGNTRFGFIGANSEATSFDGNRGGGSPVIGDMDDIRIYDRALTQEEIVLVMRGDPLLAWNENPADGSTPDVDNATPLTWSPGDNANRHDVYFGTDEDAVAAADTSDATGVDRGNQSGTSYAPAEGVEWGAGPFYWRVDENNTDGTVTKGRVWSFTVADFILVDDFESYTDDDTANQAIWQSWIDGFDVPANGAQVGYLLPPYAEQTIVNSGGQSMPLSYDNTAGVSNSQAELTLTSPRDWTKHGVGVLSLWFRGYPPSVGGFTEGPAGAYTMTAAGADIWGSSDRFHFAYKVLTGPGTIVARVDSVQNTDGWAKAGVMIRETLDPGSKHAFACVTPDNGVSSQGRTDTDSSSFNADQAGITAPHWVKLERDVGGNFTASHSTNGTAWQPVENALPTNIPMTSNVYVGLAVTSHDADLTCEAKFSNVTITGTAGPQWEHRDIGIFGNAAESLYVALSNTTGAWGTVVHEDPGAATIETWTEWVIDLKAFADQGVNMSNVDKIAIGLGVQGDAGGSGTVFIDDIKLYRPGE